MTADAGMGRVLAHGTDGVENKPPYGRTVAESFDVISWKISLCLEFAVLLFIFGRN